MRRTRQAAALRDAYRLYEWAQVTPKYRGLRYLGRHETTTQYRKRLVESDNLHYRDREQNNIKLDFCTVGYNELINLALDNQV
jgi:hypothetical protein